MGPSSILRSLVAVAAFVAIAIAGSSGAAAQDDIILLTIHTSECFTGVGPDIFEECHDDGVGNVAFDVNGSVFIADETGVLELFGGPTDVGPATITEDPAVFGAYLGAYVYCRNLTNDEVLFDGSVTDSGGSLTIEAALGDNIVCDWYNITAAPSGGTDGGTTSGSTTSGATTLPATGAGTATSDSPMLALALAGGFVVLGLGLRRRAIV